VYSVPLAEIKGVPDARPCLAVFKVRGLKGTGSSFETLAPYFPDCMRGHKGRQRERKKRKGAPLKHVV
jgi:hypothetical protein